MVFPRPVAGVVFDMDGLLVDSEILWREALQAEAAAWGRALPLEVAHSLIGLPSPESQARLAAHFGPGFELERFLQACALRYQALKGEGVALKTGVVELLDLLDELGAPRAIATSSSRDTVRAHLGRHALLPRFHAVVAQGDYARGKPHPDPYLKAAEALGLDPVHCLALEDSHNGVRAACAAGMMTVMVPDLLEATEEMQGLCVAVVATLHQVREAILATRGG